MAWIRVTKAAPARMAVARGVADVSLSRVEGAIARRERTRPNQEVVERMSVGRRVGGDAHRLVGRTKAGREG